MALADDLERVAAAVSGGEAPAGILAAEPLPGRRAYVLAFAGPDEARSWLVLDGSGRPVADRAVARDAVSIAALCEIAEEAAFPGDLDELRASLVALRVAERPEGIEEAEAAALALQREVGAPPHLATPERLDALGRAAQRLERALDPTGPSPFSAAMRSAQAVVDELWAEVERTHRVPFDAAS